MTPVPPFGELALDPDPPVDVLALALACELRSVDVDRALGTLDDLAGDLAEGLALGDGTALSQAHTLAEVLGSRHGFAGDADQYDRPENSMLDVVLERRRGLPILLSVVYVSVARRAGVELFGVGLPGHFVVGHFGEHPPVLLDPFGGGAIVEPGPDAVGFVRPWTPHETAMRMLNNLVASYQRRGNLAAALRAAEMRTDLPGSAASRETAQAELASLRARLN